MALDIVTWWTGPIPTKSMRHNFFKDYIVHPLLRHNARSYLKQLKFLGCQVIGITGSFGKTSTKDALFAILSQVAPTVRTKENIDPVYNIPTTILKTPPWTKYLILEMGIEYPGEMNFYLWLAPVDIAVITGIGLTHTEHLTNTETIYSEKSQITQHAKDVVDYSKKSPSLTSHLEIAAQVAQLLHISQADIQVGLANFIPPPHRMQRIDHPSGAIIIDDTYNANPTAVKLAIAALVDVSQREKKTPVFVLGQMNELGTFETSAHQEIGRLVAKSSVKHLLCIGPATQETIRSAKIGTYYNSQPTLLKGLQPFLKPQFAILIKGSRSWHLENLVEKLLHA